MSQDTVDSAQDIGAGVLYNVDNVSYMCTGFS